MNLLWQHVDDKIFVDIFLFQCCSSENINRRRSLVACISSTLKLNPEHRPHDGRKHFVTMAEKYGVDEYAIKYMVGHKISDITEKACMQREFEWLKEEIEKIK